MTPPGAVALLDTRRYVVMAAPLFGGAAAPSMLTIAMTASDVTTTVRSTDAVRLSVLDALWGLFARPCECRRRPLDVRLQGARDAARPLLERGELSVLGSAEVVTHRFRTIADHDPSPITSAPGRRAERGRPADGCRRRERPANLVSITLKNHLQSGPCAACETDRGVCGDRVTGYQRGSRVAEKPRTWAMTRETMDP